MITSFLGILKAKKKYSANKKNTNQQTKLLIQRKHLYAYDMTFLCPPTPPSQTKKYQSCNYTFDNSGIPKRNMYLMRILYWGFPWTKENTDKNGNTYMPTIWRFYATHPPTT